MEQLLHSSFLPSRRRLLQGAGALSLASVLPGAAFAQSDLRGITLRVATYKGGHKTLLETAGLAQTPYQIEWKEFNSGVLHIEGINADALDLGSGSEIPAVFAAKAKASVKVVGVYHEDLNNQVTLAQKDAPIHKVADLRGKRVGYVRATTSHLYLYQQLKEAGLSFDDIKAVNLSPADGLSAFARGDIDAWAIYGYNGQLARTKHGARTLKTAVGYLSGNFLIYANPKAVEDVRRQLALADLLQRLQKAYVWGNSNFLVYAKAQSAQTRVPVGDLVEIYNNRSQNNSLVAVSDKAIESHQRVADAFQAMGVLEAGTDVKPLWDKTFNRYLGVKA